MKKIQKLLCATFALVLTACGYTQNVQEQQTMRTYPAKPLYFHYYQIDIPQDIAVDDSQIEAEFWGNRFFAYPIASQEAFDELVSERINVFKNHKLSEKALAYERESRQTLNEYAGEDVKISYPQLNMTTALYEAIRYDAQHYKIIANSLNNLDSSFNTSLYMQYYMYVPEQHQYIMTKQNKQPASLIASRDQYKSGKTFLTEVLSTNKNRLNNQNFMAVGPVVWMKPDSHPNIEYRMASKAVPMSLHLDVGARKDKGETKDELEETISTIDYLSEGKSKKIYRGNRDLAGMKGIERCYLATASELNESSYVWCAWGTDGEKEDLNKPSILLEMEYEVGSSSTDIQYAMDAWKQLMDSFKRRTTS